MKLSDVINNDAKTVSQNIRSQVALADIGLKFILDDKIKKDVLNLDENIINNVFKVIAEALTTTNEK